MKKSEQTIINKQVSSESENETKKIDADEVARLMSERYNVATRGKHMANEVRFSFFNQNNIMKALGYGYEQKARTWVRHTDKPRAIDMLDAPKHPGEPILVIGSGPTFDEAAPILKNWKGDIITSTSQASTCIYFGKEPTYIVALDPDSFADEMKIDSWKGRKSILILHPGVTPNLIEEWQGPMYLFRKLQPQTPFFDNAQKIGYSTLGELKGQTWGAESKILIRAQVPMLACVLSAQICIAKQLGYQRQFLVGADLGMPNNKTRFTKWEYDKKQWQELKPPSFEDYKTQAQQKGDPVVITANGTPSSAMFIFYGHQIVTAWRLTEADIISASDKSILTIFPYAPINEIIRKQGQGIKGYNKKKIRWVTEKYLARQNVYFLYVGKGVMPHEFKDPLHDIPKMLSQVKEALKAQGKEKEVDIDANMRRIKKLFNEVTKANAP